MGVAKDQKLDRILKAWAAARAPGARELELLEQRVLYVLSENNQVDRSHLATGESGKIRHWRGVAIVTATAAAVLFVGLAIHSMVHRDSRDRAVVETDAESFAPALLSEADADHGKRLLAELQKVFDRQVIWVSEGAGEVSVGVAPSSPLAVPARNRFIAIRVTLVGRRAESEPWKVIDTINVIAGQQETVELAQGSNVGSGVFVWAYPLVDGSIAVDLHGWNAGPNKISISSSNILKPGKLLTIKTYTENGVEYRVLQATELLKSDELG